MDRRTPRVGHPGLGIRETAASGRTAVAQAEEPDGRRRRPARGRRGGDRTRRGRAGPGCPSLGHAPSVGSDHRRGAAEDAGPRQRDPPGTARRSCAGRRRHGPGNARLRVRRPRPVGRVHGCDIRDLRRFDPDSRTAAAADPRRRRRGSGCQPLRRRRRSGDERAGHRPVQPGHPRDDARRLPAHRPVRSHGRLGRRDAVRDRRVHRHRMVGPASTPSRTGVRVPPDGCRSGCATPRRRASAGRSSSPVGAAPPARPAPSTGSRPAPGARFGSAGCRSH